MQDVRKPEVTHTHPFLFEFLTKVPKETDSLIDLGCGRGIVGALMRIYRSPRNLIGVDVFPEYLKFCSDHGFYDECLLWDLRRLPLPFKGKEFDVATCLETIEHLPKDDGERLLDELDRIAKIVVVSTPNTFFTQPRFDGNRFQAHLSRWSVWDFSRRGYRIRGVGELKSKIRYLKLFLPRLGHAFPFVSEYLLAFKKIWNTYLACDGTPGGASENENTTSAIYNGVDLGSSEKG